MRKIRDILPFENIIYFADTARLPYGNKNSKTLLNYSHENVSFLLSHKIKIVIIACHSACSAALDELKASFDVPIIGITEHGVEEVIQSTKNKKIAILGTKATISSDVYQKRLHQYMPTANLFPVPCPLFVPLIEEGDLDNPRISLAIEKHLDPLKDKEIDTILLACTHYPLILSHLSKKFRNTHFIDPAFACAQATFKLLMEKDLLNSNPFPNYTFYASDNFEKFSRLAQRLLVDHSSMKAAP